MGENELETVFNLCKWERKFKAHPPDDKRIKRLWSKDGVVRAAKQLEKTKEKKGKFLRSLYLYQVRDFWRMTVTEEKEES